MKDLIFIYDKLKNSYNLTLTNTMALNDGYTIDVPVIRGIGSDRRFDLYKDGDLFVFSTELFQKEEPYKYSHGHPCNVEVAMRFIKDFLECDSAN